MTMHPVDVPRYAVIGHPIAHSLSPRIHAEFARQCGRTLDYRAIDAAPDVFAQTVRSFFAAGGAGLNVTLPHKAAAYSLADKHGESARRAGVANVLTPATSGGVRADNTDGIGLLRDLRDRHGLKLPELHVLLLGAGGAAHGVATALLDAGIERLTIANRSRERANSLATALADQRVTTGAWKSLRPQSPFDLVIHATAVGVRGGVLVLPDGSLADRPFCYDLSYGSAARAFLVAARRAGARHTSDGLGMLIEQAAASFAIWHGVQPETEPVHRMLRAGSG